MAAVTTWTVANTGDQLMIEDGASLVQVRADLLRAARFGASVTMRLRGFLWETQGKQWTLQSLLEPREALELAAGSSWRENPRG